MGPTALHGALVVAGAACVGASTLHPGPEPATVTAGAGVLGAGLVGLAVEGLLATAAGVDATVVGLGCGALFARVAVVDWTFARLLSVDGLALAVVGALTVGAGAGYRAGTGPMDGLRHGLLTCGLGGVLCVVLVPYDATGIGAFDVVVAVSGVGLPALLGVLGGASGAFGWWLASRIGRPDPLS